jgi:polyisoprenyl-phosphate glycosyltransferase
MYSFSIICPVFNESKNLLKFFNKLKVNLKGFANYQVVFVNDGSLDNSLTILKNFKKKNKYIKIINFSKNFGHQNAIVAGLKSMEAEFYIVLDTDGQHEPSHIPQLISLYKSNIRKQIEIIQMKKIYSNYESKLKIFFSIMYYYFFKKISGIEIKKGSSDFYLISNRVKKVLLKSNFSKDFLRGFLHWSGFLKLYIPYYPKKREHGKSSYNFTKQIDFALRGIFNFQTKFFLKIFFFSLLLLFCSIVYIAFIIYDYFINSNIISGWSVSLLLQITFGSIVFFLISFLVYAVTKILNIVSNKPDYIIKEVL